MDAPALVRIMCQQGVPTVCYFALTWFLWQRIKFSFWRFRLLLQTEPGRIGVQRVASIAPHFFPLTLQLLLLVSAPISLLGVWGGTLAYYHSVIIGVSVILLGLTIAFGAFALNQWQGRQWRIDRVVAVAFCIAGLCYFTTAFLAAFGRPNVNFFGQSIYFLALNFLCIIELTSRAQSAHQVNPLSVLEVRVFAPPAEEETPAAGAAGAAVPANPSSAGAAGGNATSLLVAPMTFEKRLQAEMDRARADQARFLLRNFFTFYGLSVLVLVAYSITVFLAGAAPNSPAAGFDPRFLGIIISIGVCCLDGLIYLYAGTGQLSNLPGGSHAQTLLLAIVRCSLVAFGAENWFLGACLIFLLFGAALVVSAVRERLRGRFTGSAASDDAAGSSSSSSSAKQQARLMPLSEFLDADFDPSTPVSAARAAFVSWVNRSPITVSELALGLLTLLYVAAAVVHSRLGAQPFSLGGRADLGPGETAGFALGVLGVAGLTAWLALTYHYHSGEEGWLPVPWKKALFISLLCWAAYWGLAGALYDRFSSLSSLLLVGLCPLVVITSVSLIRHWRTNHYQFTAPPEARSPPMAEFWSSLFTGRLSSIDYISLAHMLLLASTSLTLGLAGGLSASNPAVCVLVALAAIELPCFMICYCTLSGSLRYGPVLWLSASLALLAHGGVFVSAQWGMGGFGEGTGTAGWVAWSLCGLTLAAGVALLGLRWAKTRSLSPKSSPLFMVGAIGGASAAGVSVALSFWAVSPLVGVLLVVGLGLLGLAGWLLVTWTREHYSLVGWRLVSAYVLAGLVATAGIVAGFVVSDGKAAFWLFSSAWFVVCVFALLAAWGRVKSIGDGDATLHFTKYVFPVYAYDPRLQNVVPTDTPFAYVFGGLLLLWVWSLIALLLNYVSVGLGVSAVVIVFGYAYIRELGLRSTREFSEVATYITEDMVRQAHSIVYNAQVMTVQTALDLPAVNAIAKAGGNPVKLLSSELTHMLTKRGAQLLCGCPSKGAAQSGGQGADDADMLTLNELVRADEQLNTLTAVDFRFRAHYHVMICSMATDRLPQEQALFKDFTRWLKVTHGIEVDPYVTHQQCFGEWSEAKRQQLERYKAEFLFSKEEEQRRNDRARIEEDEGSRRREEALRRRMEEQARIQREMQEEQRRQQEEEQRRKRETQTVTVTDGVPTPTPTPAPEPVPSGPMTVDQQYKLIEAQAAKTGKPWEDREFTAGDHALCLEMDTGSHPNCRMRVGVSEWLRPSEIVAECQRNGELGGNLRPVWSNGYDLADVEQGAIGNCYFISALGLLAMHEKRFPNQKLLSSILVSDLGKSGYPGCGAFVVQFYREGENVRFMIDDRLPVTGNRSLAFARSKQREEFWVPLIEKAYCKFYTCYEATISGKIHHALVDMTNGSGEEIKINKDKSGRPLDHLDTLWKRIKTAFESGALLGVSSNPGSDHQSKNGIAFGHAYMISNLYSDSDHPERLIQLANPWGRGEWDGDWSDSSDKWTPYWREKLELKEEDDGRFWMDFRDFVLFYQSISVCRLLPKVAGARAAWKGESAAGPRAPAKNPQFLITPNKRTSVVIEVAQRNVRGEKDAKLKHINWFLMRADGKRVEAISQGDKLVAMGQPGFRDVVSVGKEVPLDHVREAYTLVPCAVEAGAETTFAVNVYCADGVSALEFAAMEGNVAEAAVQVAKIEDDSVATA